MLQQTGFTYAGARLGTLQVWLLPNPSACSWGDPEGGCRQQPCCCPPCPAPARGHETPSSLEIKNKPSGPAHGTADGLVLQVGVPKAAPGQAARHFVGNEQHAEKYTRTKGICIFIHKRTHLEEPSRAQHPSLHPPDGQGRAGPGLGGGGARQSPALGGELSPAARPAPALPPAPPAPPLGGPARPRRPRRRRPAPAPLGPSPPSERRRAGRRLPPTPRLLHWQPPGIPTIARLLGASSRSPPRPHRPGPARPFAVTLRGAAFQARPGKAAGGRACCRLAEREDPVGSEATLSV